MNCFVVAALAALLLPGSVAAQQSLMQGGSWVPGRVPMYIGQGYGNPYVQDSGPAAGGASGVGLSELGLTARGSGSAPYSATGSGPLGTNLCDNDGPTTGPYHFLCLSPNAQGGGLIAYGAANGASSLPLKINVNGTSYAFPFVLDGIVGPDTSTVGHLAVWNNATGTLLTDGGPVPDVFGPGSSTNGALVLWSGTSGTQLANGPTLASLYPGPYYVSNSESNGLPVGNDTTGNGSPSAPFLTIEKALTTATGTADIRCNGTFTPVTTYTLTGNTSLSPAAEGGCTLRAVTGQTGLLYVNPAFSSTVTVTGLTLDGRSTTTPLVYAQGGTAFTYGIVLAGVTLKDYALYGVAEGAVAAFNLTVTDSTCTSAVGSSCFYLPHQSDGAISVDALTATIAIADPNFTAGSVVHLAANASGPTFNFTGAYNLNVTANNGSSKIYRAIYVTNVPNATVGCGSESATTQCGTISISLGTSCRAVEMHGATSGSVIQSNGIKIYGTAFTTDCYAGHGGATIGTDGYPGASYRDKANSGRIFNNTFALGSHVAGALIEGGPFCGWVTDCQAYRNRVDYNTNGSAALTYGIILKGCTECEAYTNILTGLNKQGILLKGGSSNRVINNTHYETANPTVSILTPFTLEIADTDSTEPTTGNYLRNNIIAYLNGGTTTGHFLSSIGSGNTATFANNNYYLAGAMSSSAKWTYDGTSYSSLATWQAAVEASATGYSPGFADASNGVVTLTSGSALIAGGSALSAPFLYDFALNPFAAADPSIGAYQSNSSSLTGYAQLAANPNTFTGVQKVPAGTAGAPPIYMGTDTDTGFFLSAVGAWDFTVNGTAVSRLHSTGIQVGSGACYEFSTGSTPGTAGKSICQTTGGITFGAPIAPARLRKSSNFTAGVASFYDIDAGSGAVSVTLPNCDDAHGGVQFTFKKISGTTTHAINIIPQSGEKVDGATGTYSFTAGYGSVTLVCGTSGYWWKAASYVGSGGTAP